jgi:hypothetical protein
MQPYFDLTRWHMKRSKCCQEKFLIQDLNRFWLADPLTCPWSNILGCQKCCGVNNCLGSTIFVGQQIFGSTNFGGSHIFWGKFWVSKLVVVNIFWVKKIEKKQQVFYPHSKKLPKFKHYWLWQNSKLTLFVLIDRNIRPTI